MERWLTDALGLDWVTADEEAARLEHAVSDLVERRLTPGAGVRMVEVDDVGRTLRVATEEREMTLSQETGGKIWVVPGDGSRPA